MIPFDSGSFSTYDESSFVTAAKQLKERNRHFMEKSRFLVFSDLDGTLLDHSTYSFEAARPALQALKDKGIPLILCTSKTRAETERHRRDLENKHPFISENGGAAFIPKGHFPFEIPEARREASYQILEFGAPYAAIRKILGQIRNSVAPSIRGFGDMDTREVADLCGFSLADAGLAQKREYDEPFLVSDEKHRDAAFGMAWGTGLRIVKGGRFYHLLGDNDKGRAVAALRALYERAWGPMTTIGIGDSLNDLSMLKAVDVPILVQKPDGTYDQGIKIRGLTLATGPGPEGWRESLLTRLTEEPEILA